MGSSIRMCESGCDKKVQSVEEVLQIANKRAQRQLNSVMDAENMNQKDKYLDDFDETKNRKAYSESQMAKMNRWQKFEKSFPFYRMDVNGFMKLINNAQRITIDDPDVPLYEIRYVTLSSLQQAFAKNELWSNELRNDDPQNPSRLLQLLNNTCTYQQEGIGEVAYDVNVLRCIAIMWCDGDKQEKVVEFYDMLQDNDQPVIAANDKDFVRVLKAIFDFSGYTILHLEEVFSDQKQFESVSIQSMSTQYLTPNKNKESTLMTLEQIQYMRDEKYDEVCEEFIDEIFGYDCKLNRKDFEQLVIEKQKWIFDTNQIRKKIGWQ